MHMSRLPIWGTICKYENGMLKVARNAFYFGESGTHYVAMVTNLLSSYCGAPLAESYLKNQTFLKQIGWDIFLSSYLIKIGLNIWHHHLANLHILKLEYLWNEKRYLKI